MRLKSINRVLRIFNLVLVISRKKEDGMFIDLRIELASRYDRKLNG